MKKKKKINTNVTTTGKAVRMSTTTVALLEKLSLPRESYNDTLLRVLLEAATGGSRAA